MSRMSAVAPRSALSEAPTFEVNEAVQAEISRLSDEARRSAFDLADEMIMFGQPLNEASSIAAHLLVRAAWSVAGAGALAEGRAPNADHFRAAVEEAIKAIDWAPLVDPRRTDGDRP